MAKSKQGKSNKKNIETKRKPVLWTWIDVRSPSEFLHDANKAPGTKNVPLRLLVKEFHATDRKTPIGVIGKDDNEASIAEQYLASMGFTMLKRKIAE